MNISYKSYTEVPQLSFKDLAYIQKEDFLKPYFHYNTDLATFEKTIANRKQTEVNRPLLHKVVSDAYKTIEATTLQHSNIDALLKENTFTVITAHQPSLLGGPLYYIYKICSTIHLAQKLNKTYKDVHVVPVFVSGGEDHDFEEIDHLSLYGKTVKWDREAKGPVGRLSTEGLAEVISKVEDILGTSQGAQTILDILKQALDNADSYGDFVFRWVNALFGKYGLIMINMDQEDLKRNFIPILEKELTNRPSQKLVQDTQDALDTEGWKSQAFPRDINLFYLGTRDRLRITYEGDRYTIVDTDLSYTKEEIVAKLHKSPQDFSPNVVMRPLYQEYTLPNLAYIGGGGEIAYWLERKSQFEYFDIFYPMLVRRNSVLQVGASHQKQLSKLALSLDQLFQKEDEIISLYLTAQSDDELVYDEELTQIQSAYESLAEKAKLHDPTLSKSILASMTKQLKDFENLGGRIKRALKSKEEVNVNRIKKLKDQLFPNDGLQERVDNFLPYFVKYGHAWIDYLVENLDPLDSRFAILDTDS